VHLADRIHLVGSGANGFGLTDPYDCHIYLVDGGSELALIDVGAGMGAARVIEHVERDGLDPGLIRHILCTHAHGDHAGGAAAMRALLPKASLASAREAADPIRKGDEVWTSVASAKTAGIYPAGYHLEPCQVDRELGDGDRIVVGDLELECIDTPGHARGHVSFLLEHAGRRSLFCGDVVFHRGTILLQNTHDCRLNEQVASLRKLRQLAVDALLPGHFAFSLRDGQHHIERANAVLDQLLIPPQALSAW
jgi:glyoxylase-like metal-dependent hydrolase (beta-lactamase superfamily II)